MKKSKTMTSRGISRIDSHTTHGWFVRAYRNGKTYSRFFADRKHGSRRKALALAVEYRDKLHSWLRSVPKRPRRIHNARRPNTGYIGVSQSVRKSRNGENIIYYANWSSGGKSHRTTFSTRKYGKKKALALAVDRRKRAMREIYGPRFYSTKEGKAQLLR